MLQPTRNSTNLRPHHGAAIVVGIAVAAIVAYGAFSFVVGTIAFIVKLAIVLGIAYLVVRLVFRRARR